jgi:hypothetical protein
LSGCSKMPRCKLSLRNLFCREPQESLVGNGLKPFPTQVRGNKPALCLTRGGMREIPRSAGLKGVFQQPNASKERRRFHDDKRRNP